MLPRFVALMFCLLAAPVAAQSQEYKGQVKVGVHPVALEAEQLYRIQVSCPFIPGLMIDDRGMLPDRVGDHRYEVVFAPSATRPHRLTVMSAGREERDKLLDYTLRIEQLHQSKEPALSFEKKLTKKTTRGRVYYVKQFPISLVAGKAYFFRVGAENNQVNIRIRDADGEEVERDWSPGAGGGQLQFKPADDGKHYLSIQVFSDNEPTVKVQGSMIDTEREPDKVQTEKGQVKVCSHLVTLKAEQLYAVHVDGGFYSNVHLGEKLFGNLTSSQKDKTNFLAVYTPSRSQEELFVVRPAGPPAEKNSLDYTLSFEPLQRDGKPLLETREKLSKETLVADVGPLGYARVIPLSLVAGQRYLFEVKGDKSDPTMLELYEPGADKWVAETLQGLDEESAQLLIEAQRTGEYRLMIGFVNAREREVSISVYPVRTGRK